MDPSLNDKVWNLIDSYFKTINRNLVNHQLDSYNMFIMSQLPRTIRQFNPMQLMYANDKGDTTTKIEIIIGGTIREKNKRDNTDVKYEILNMFNLLGYREFALSAVYICINQ